MLSRGLKLNELPWQTLRIFSNDVFNANSSINNHNGSPRLFVTTASAAHSAAQFFREEEKRLIVKNWAAECAAEVVVAEHRSGRSVVIVDRTVGIEYIVAKEFIQTAMEAVRSRPRDNIDLTRGRPAKLRAVVAARDFELGDGIHAGINQQRNVGPVVHIVNAVNCPVVLALAVTVDGKAHDVDLAARVRGSE